MNINLNKNEQKLSKEYFFINFINMNGYKMDGDILVLKHLLILIGLLDNTIN